MNNELMEIPSEFSTIPLKYGVERKSIKIDGSSGNLPQVSLDMVEPWTGKVENMPDSGSLSSGLVKFQPGDVLFNKLRPYLAKAFKANCTGLASPEFLVLRPQKFVSEYLQYILTSPEFVYRVDASTYGAKMPRASWDFIGNISIPCPSKNQQKAIVSALNKKTVSIDQAITTCDGILSLLAEQKESKSEKYIIEGLDDCEHKCTDDIEFLENIPEHWETRRAKTLFTPRDERGFDQLPLLEVSLNYGVRLREQNTDRTAWVASDLTEMKRVAEGDLVFNKMRLWQGAIGRSEFEGLVSPDYIVLEPHSNVSTDYYSQLLRTEAYKTEVNRRSYGVVDDRNRIYWKQFGDIPLLHPPLEEQNNIINKLQYSNTQTEELQSDIKLVIKLLKEKRQAIVTKAVTGQINITENQTLETEIVS